MWSALCVKHFFPADCLEVLRESRAGGAPRPSLGYSGVIEQLAPLLPLVRAQLSCAAAALLTGHLLPLPLPAEDGGYAGGGNAAVLEMRWQQVSLLVLLWLAVAAHAYPPHCRKAAVKFSRFVYSATPSPCDGVAMETHIHSESQ